MHTDLLFYLFAIPAVILTGLAKGGFAGVGMLGTPLMAMVVGPVEAAAVLLPILIVQDAVGIWAFRRTFDAGILKLLVPSAVFGIFLGWALAAYTSRYGVELALGVISVVFSVQRLWGEYSRALPTDPPPPWVGVLCGIGSGFTSQVAHAGAPPFQIYVMPKGLDRDVLVGTTAIFFGIVNAIKVPAYIGLGVFSPATLGTSAALVPLALASTYAGVWWVRRVDAAVFYRIVYVLLGLLGLKLVWDGASGLLGG
jgi:uncharacterized membrane protein YfcA